MLIFHGLCENFSWKNELGIRFEFLPAVFYTGRTVLHQAVVLLR